MRKITLGTLNISDTGKRYVNNALDNNRLSSGIYTKMFEDKFSLIHGCRHGIFCNSGTSALQIALAALKEVHGYKDGDEVIVPATTFIASSNVILQNNLTPVFVDVDPYTFNIDPWKIEAKITHRTRAIMPVHLFGLPADMSLIMPIARNSNLQVIEDSCETMFATQYNRSVGSFGDIACFSTYVAHLIVGGVGGVVTTSDDRLADICRSLMAHGRNSTYTNIDQDDEVSKQMIERRYQFERVGYSYRATELEAAIALSELERWKGNILTRQANAEYLTSLLSVDVSPMIQLPRYSTGSDHVFMMYPMVLGPFIDRDKFLFHLEKNGIETRYLFPLLSQPIYQKLFPGLAKEYPVSQRLAERGFFIGIHQGLTLGDMSYVYHTIKEAIRA